MKSIAERIERIAQAVTEDEFVEAAKVYAEALATTERRQEIGNIFTLVKLRERFINLYLMTVAR